MWLIFSAFSIFPLKTDSFYPHLPKFCPSDTGSFHTTAPVSCYSYNQIHQKFSGSKHCLFMILHFCRSEVWHRSSWAKNQCLGRCAPFWRPEGRLWFQAHSGCWQNSVSCPFRTVTPVPGWLAVEGCPPLVEAAPLPCQVAPSSPESQWCCLGSCSCQVWKTSVTRLKINNVKIWKSSK